MGQRWAQDSSLCLLWIFCPGGRLSLRDRERGNYNAHSFNMPYHNTLISHVWVPGNAFYMIPWKGSLSTGNTITVSCASLCRADFDHYPQDTQYCEWGKKCLHYWVLYASRFWALSILTPSRAVWMEKGQHTTSAWWAWRTQRPSPDWIGQLDRASSWYTAKLWVLSRIRAQTRLN